MDKNLLKKLVSSTSWKGIEFFTLHWKLPMLLIWTRLCTTNTPYHKLQPTD